MKQQLEEMQTFLNHFTGQQSPVKGAWIAASMYMACGEGKSTWHAHQLRKWTKAYINDCTKLPTNIYGTWNISWLEENDLAEELHLHLQGIGKHVWAMDIVHYLDWPEVKAFLT